MTDEDIALAAVTGFANIDAKSSDVKLVNKRLVALGEKSFTVFFFISTSAEGNTTLFGPSENKLAAAAFANDKNGINAQSWKIVNAVPVLDESELGSDCDAIIDRLLNGSHTRASFGKQKFNAFPAYPEEEF